MNPRINFLLIAVISLFPVACFAQVDTGNVVISMDGDCSTYKGLNDMVKPSHQPYRKLATFKKDTAAYLYYNFIQRKDKYVNKSFSKLIHDLEFPIFTYMPMNIFCNKFVYKGIYVFSYDIQKRVIRQRLKLKPFDLIIQWANPLLKKDADPIVLKNKGYWDKAAADYFGSQIVGDVLKTEYQYPRDKNEY